MSNTNTYADAINAAQSGDAILHAIRIDIPERQKIRADARKLGLLPELRTFLGAHERFVQQIVRERTRLERRAAELA